METNFENKETQGNVEDIATCVKDVFGKLIDLLRKLLRMRLEIRKDGQVRKNIPLVACCVFAMISLKLTVAAVIIGLLCGYTANVKCE